MIARVHRTLLTLILKFIDDPKTVHSILLTCKNIKPLVIIHLQRLNMSLGLSPEAIVLIKAGKLQDELDIEHLALLRNLRILNLSWRHELRNLDSIKNLKSLQTLDLSYCLGIRKVEPLKALHNLQSLEMKYCPFLNDIEGLKVLTNLQSLNLSHSLGGVDILNAQPYSRHRFDFLSVLTKLHTLNLNWCMVRDCKPLQSLTNLHSLYLNLSELETIEPLRALTNLQILYLKNSSMVPTQDNLRILKLKDCSGVDLCAANNVDTLASLHGLQLLV
eukprot:Awhi_evm1s5661